MQGIEEYAATVLLPQREAITSSGGCEGALEGESLGLLSFFEIKGSQCIELLGENHGRELPLRQEPDGKYQPIGVVQAEIRSAAGLLELISVGKSRRRTEATGANAVSSRSHAVCQLTLRGPGQQQRNGALSTASNARRGSRTERPAMLT